MRTEALLFNLPAAFFFAAGTAYGLLADWEVVGTVCLFLSGALATMIGVYFRMLAKRHGPRPEDVPGAEIHESAGEYGTYAPWSWWPLVLAAAAAVAFLSLAVGWWLMIPAAIVGIIGLLGWVFEFSRGQHAH